MDELSTEEWDYILWNFEMEKLDPPAREPRYSRKGRMRRRLRRTWLRIWIPVSLRIPVITAVLGTWL